MGTVEPKPKKISEEPRRGERFSSFQGLGRSREGPRHRTPEHHSGSSPCPNKPLTHRARSRLDEAPHQASPENHKWSLYWKCSMATHTFTLDPFDIEVDPAVMTAMQLRRKLAETIGMRPEDELCRLESFVEPWELW